MVCPSRALARSNPFRLRLARGHGAPEQLVELSQLVLGALSQTIIEAAALLVGRRDEPPA